MIHIWVSQVAQRLRVRLPMQETQVQSLGGEDPLEKENGKPTLVTNFHARGNSIDRGAWQATVHRVTKSQIQVSD